MIARMRYLGSTESFAARSAERLRRLSQAKVGWWRTYDCELDLEQIDSEEMLVQTVDQNAIPYRVWPTKEAALQELEGTDAQ